MEPRPSVEIVGLCFTKALVSWGVLVLWSLLLVGHTAGPGNQQPTTPGRADSADRLDTCDGSFSLLGACAAPSEKRDFYRLLGVKKNATQRQIDKAYRRIAKELHPDVNPGKEAEFMEVAKAHEVLSNPEERKKYDMYGEAGLQGGMPGGEGQDGGFPFDLFADLFGGGGGGHRGGGGPRMHFTFNSGGGAQKTGTGGGNNSGFRAFNTDDDINKNLYDDVDIITELSPNSFDREINMRDNAYVVKVYNPNCWPCRDLKPDYGVASQNLLGVVPFGAVNCKAHKSMAICRQIRSYPSILFYGLDKKQPPILLKGRKKFEDIIEFVGQNLPRRFSELRNDTMEEWLTTNSKLTKVIFFSDSNPPSPMVLMAAVSFHSRLDIAVVYKTEKTLLKNYFLNPTKYNSQKPIGSVDFPSLLKIEDIDTLGGEWIRTRGMNAETLNLKLSRIVAQSRVQSELVIHPLTPRRMLAGECSATDGQFCFILIMPFRNAAWGISKSSYDALKAMTEKFKRDPLKIVWLDAQQYPAFAAAFGYSDSTKSEMMIAYRPKRKMYQVLKHPFTTKQLEEFIGNVVSGSPLSSSLKSVPSLDARKHDEL